MKVEEWRGSGGCSSVTPCSSPRHDAPPWPGSAPAPIGWWPWCPAQIILWGLQNNAELLLPQATEVHIQERDASVSARDAPEAVWVLAGDEAHTGRKNRSCLLTLGMSLQQHPSADLDPGPAAQQGLSPFTHGRLCREIPGSAPSMQRWIPEGWRRVVALGCVCLRPSQGSCRAAQRGEGSTWLPALCILSPFIISLFHLCCTKSWETAACGCRHLLGEPILPQYWVIHSRGCRALLVFAVWGMKEMQKSLLSLDLPSQGHRGALGKVKLPFGLCIQCLGSGGTLVLCFG